MGNQFLIDKTFKEGTIFCSVCNWMPYTLRAHAYVNKVLDIPI